MSLAKETALLVQDVGTKAAGAPAPPAFVAVFAPASGPAGAGEDASTAFSGAAPSEPDGPARAGLAAGGVEGAHAAAASAATAASAAHRMRFLTTFGYHGLFALVVVRRSPEAKDRTHIASAGNGVSPGVASESRDVASPSGAP